MENYVIPADESFRLIIVEPDKLINEGNVNNACREVPIIAWHVDVDKDAYFDVMPVTPLLYVNRGIQDNEICLIEREMGDVDPKKPIGIVAKRGATGDLFVAEYTDWRRYNMQRPISEFLGHLANYLKEAHDHP